MASAALAVGVTSAGFGAEFVIGRSDDGFHWRCLHGLGKPHPRTLEKAVSEA